MLTSVINAAEQLEQQWLNEQLEQQWLNLF